MSPRQPGLSSGLRSPVSHTARAEQFTSHSGYPAASPVSHSWRGAGSRGDTATGPPDLEAQPQAVEAPGSVHSHARHPWTHTLPSVSPARCQVSIPE